MNLVASEIKKKLDMLQKTSLNLLPLQIECVYTGFRLFQHVTDNNPTRNVARNRIPMRL